MPTKSGRSDYAGQSEECGHQLKIGTGGSGIESGKEMNRVVKVNERNDRGQAYEKVLYIYYA